MNRITEALADLDDDLVADGLREAMDAGVPAVEILERLQKGMEIVGERFQNGEYFLAEMIVAANIFKEAAASLDNYLAVSESAGELAEKPVFVIGTVKNDIHDIGKNIVATIMSCSGFEVIDLGVDVPAATFVQTIRDRRVDIVGLSCLLTTTFESMKEIAAAIRSEAPDLPILIGGGPVDDNVRQYVGADQYCANAHETVQACKARCGLQ